MNLNKTLNTIYCHGCIPHELLPLNPDTDIWKEGDIVRCSKCDAHLGYEWDWPEKFANEVIYNE